METLFILIGVCVAALAAMLGVVKGLIYICQPNEVLIFSGTRRASGGRALGYRLVQGGRGVRIPLLERVSSMDLTNIAIEIRAVGAYSKGGIPLTVEGVANVKVASEEPTIGNAIERFLGKPKAELVRVAKETLEGNLRGVLATLTPEEVNHDRVKFAQSLLHEADQDLQRLGLVLDTLKIQNVSDDKGYLDSLGRKQSADLQKRSRIAEAENRALSAERAAKNWEEKEIARLNANFAMSKAELERRMTEARTRKAALVAEERAAVTAEVARSQAELAVQTARIEQVKLQLLADKVRPAEAKRESMIASARADAASIVEEGRAAARSLEELSRTWTAAGESARQVFLAQRLSGLLEGMMATVRAGAVEKASFIDGRLALSNDLAVKASVTNEQLKQTTGLDAVSLLQGLVVRPR